jgi:hypothetical protein
MTTVPALTGVTMPVADMVAIAVLVLSHVPPTVALSSVRVLPIQTLPLPTIVPAGGSGSIVIRLLATASPHTLLVLYFTVSNPLVIPVTSPVVVIEIFPVATLQVPPGALAVKVVVAPWQTEAAPVSTTAAGIAFTFSNFVL